MGGVHGRGEVKPRGHRRHEAPTLSLFEWALEREGKLVGARRSISPRTRRPRVVDGTGKPPPSRLCSGIGNGCRRPTASSSAVRYNPRELSSPPRRRQPVSCSARKHGVRTLRCGKGCARFLRGVVFLKPVVRGAHDQSSGGSCSPLAGVVQPIVKPTEVVPVGGHRRRRCHAFE